MAIYYRFTGYIELPDSAPQVYELERHYKANTRQGVEIEYTRARIKEKAYRSLPKMQYKNEKQSGHNLKSVMTTRNGMIQR